MIFVPSAVPTKPGSGKGTSSSKGIPDKTRGSGRLILLGGRKGHGQAAEVANDVQVDVWELELKGRSLKKIKTVCCGCGEHGVGRQLCSGTCGGAVAVCGQECMKKVWKEGHKLWCTKR